MAENDPPRNLTERTGKHLCIRCLREVPADVYLRNDHICDACTESDEYPAPGASEKR